jgi:hypothetical protein
MPVNRIETAVLKTFPAGCASGRVFHGNLQAFELHCFFDFRVQNEMKVGRIHVAIRKNGIFRQRCECRGDCGFTCAALAAYNCDLLHWPTSFAILP